VFQHPLLAQGFAIARLAASYRNIQLLIVKRRLVVQFKTADDLDSNFVTLCLLYENEISV